VDYSSHWIKASEHHNAPLDLHNFRTSSRKNVEEIWKRVDSDSLFATVNLGKLSFKATCQLLRSPFYPLIILKLREKKGHVRKIT
jgi:hypothetical protein